MSEFIKIKITLKNGLIFYAYDEHADNLYYRLDDLNSDLYRYASIKYENLLKEIISFEVYPRKKLESVYINATIK